MDTKTCPSCGTEVPTAASRCKVCFYDFDAEAQTKSNPLVGLLALLAGMALMVAGTFYYISSQPTEQRILVDESSRTIQWVSQFQDGSLKTDRLAFDDVSKLEYVITNTGDFEIIAITHTGDRKQVQFDPDKPLRGQAEKYAELMQKPLEMVDNTTGFGKN
jgi:hypothetical protein